MLQTLVSKARFAELKGRTPSAISNWIAEGKISREALIGPGIRARIWLERADEDLARSLDPAQQAAQPRPIMPEAQPAREPGQARPEASSTTPLLGIVDDLQRRRKADADKAEHDAEAARRKLAQDEGRWIEVVEATKVWGRQLSRVITDTETFLTTTAANELADAHGIDRKAIAAQLREAYRRHREEAARTAANERSDREEALKIAAE